MQSNLAPPTQDALAKVVGIILQARDRRLSKSEEPPPDEGQRGAPVRAGKLATGASAVSETGGGAQA